VEANGENDVKQALSLVRVSIEFSPYLSQSIVLVGCQMKSGLNANARVYATSMGEVEPIPHVSTPPSTLGASRC